MQYLRHLAGHAWKPGGFGNRSVGRHFARRNAAYGGLNAHPCLRGSVGGFIRRKFSGAYLCSALARVLASLLGLAPLHKTIHPMRISHNDPTETNRHKIIPCSSGRRPTRLILATEMPGAIRMNV